MYFFFLKILQIQKRLDKIFQRTKSMSLLRDNLVHDFLSPNKVCFR